MTNELELVLIGVVVGWSLDRVIKKLKAGLSTKPCANQCCGTNEVQGEVIKGTGGGYGSVVFTEIHEDPQASEGRTIFTSALNGGIRNGELLIISGGAGGTTKIMSWEDKMIADIASGYPGVSIQFSAMSHDWRRLITIRVNTGTLNGGITMDISKYWHGSGGEHPFDDTAFIKDARQAIDNFLSRDTKIIK